MLNRGVNTWSVSGWKMAAKAISPASDKHRMAAVQLSGRLQQCWSLDINWDLYPAVMKEGCMQVGKAISMPATAVLFGLLVIVSFAMSHSAVEVKDTDWVEPVLLWIAICMPTGSGKSSLCKYLKRLIDDTRKITGLDTPTWFSDDQSFEKLGALMHDNNSKLLGLYDELAMFLSQMNVFRGKGVTDSHELAVFLQLYGANSWVRKTVSGEANFEMKHTGLTLGGFIQPSVARNLIEQPANIEKGLCQRFLWFVPKPTPVPFNELEKVNQDFSASIVGLMSDLVRNDRSVKLWQISRPCEAFQKQYDRIQEQLHTISCMDDLLSGMLSKSKGQILRVAATIHVLFNIETPLDIPTVIDPAAIKAAINLVSVCIQHAAFIAGRGNIEDMIQEMSQERSQVALPLATSEAHRNAAMSLLLPGKVLHLNALLAMRKFRDRGNKAGAVHGFEVLQEKGLGKLICTKPQRGASMMYEFEKAVIPEDSNEKTVFIEHLIEFGVSIKQYNEAYAMDDITLSTLESRKRPAPSSATPPRRSPRKNLTTVFSE